MITEKELLERYTGVFESSLNPLAKRLEDYLLNIVKEHKIERVDRVTARAKSPDRFVAKALKLNDSGVSKYAQPFEQIQDQVGARIVVFYLSDVLRIERDIVSRFFNHLEKKSLEPNDSSAFSYFGRHFILHIPHDLFGADDCKDSLPFCFELQIKTLFQHAWSEAAHDLAYKPQNGGLSNEELRYMAFTSAQAWGADQVFDRIMKPYANENLKEDS